MLWGVRHDDLVRRSCDLGLEGGRYLRGNRHDSIVPPALNCMMEGRSLMYLDDKRGQEKESKTTKHAVV